MMKYGLLRRGTTKAAVALGGAMAIAMSLFGFTAAPAAAMSPQTTGQAWVHCPWGDVCIYPEDKDPFTSPNVYPESNGKFYTYGFHQLHDQYGMHYIVDNQSVGKVLGDHGDDELTSCSGNYRIVGHNLSGGFSWLNLTPVNCIALY